MEELFVVLFGHLCEVTGDTALTISEQKIVPTKTVEKSIADGIKKNVKFLSKTYRDRESKSLTNEIIAKMAHYGFILPSGEDIIIYPIAGKLAGYYKEWEGSKDE